MPKSASYNRHGRGLTFVELIIVIACVGILSAILLSALLHPRIYADNTNGTNKQDGWGFRTGKLMTQEDYSLRIPLTNGGILETVGTGGAFRPFASTSNELSAPFLNPTEIP